MNIARIMRAFNQCSDAKLFEATLLAIQSDEESETHPETDPETEREAIARLAYELTMKLGFANYEHYLTYTAHDGTTVTYKPVDLDTKELANRLIQENDGGF